MKTFNFFIFLSMTISLSQFFYACSGKDVDQNNPQAILDDAEEDIKDKRYQMALEKLKNVKNKFPYSNLATVAHLRIADVNFLEESYIESAASYETFRDLHPKYEKADYVIFRIAESYFNQLPGSIDRDLTPATKAINAYSELLQLYPKSSFAQEAKVHQSESIELLSQKEKYIGDFYFKREMFDSAAKRYEKIATKYSGSTDEEFSYLRWGQSLIAMSTIQEFSDQKSALLGEAKHVFKTYLSQFPNGKYTSDIKKLSKKMNDFK